jgi:4-hydroxyphenylpyruvate dioxygenase
MLSLENPCQLNGFAFLEFSSPKPKELSENFQHLGFTCLGTHQSQNFEVWQQQQITFLINSIPFSQAEEHAKTHGSGPCAMGFRVENAIRSHEIALNRGAHQAPPHPIYHFPAIAGIGGSLIYFVNESFHHYLNDCVVLSKKPGLGFGLEYIDHLTHNVHRGQLQHWSDFYHKIFCFHEIRDFDIQGQHTGLYSQALASPCGKIKIPLNESKDDKSQIEEFLQEYHGEGIQHIALHTSNIYQTVEQIRKTGSQFLNTPDTYFDMISERLPWQQESIEKLKKLKILIDGGPKKEDGLLLQIFTENIFGPVFFEIIQRKGHPGFGEGNFQALFEAIERDQILRGKLEEK